MDEIPSGFWLFTANGVWMGAAGGSASVTQETQIYSHSKLIQRDRRTHKS